MAPKASPDRCAMELLKLLSHGKQGASSTPSSPKPAANTTTISTTVGYDNGGGDSDDDGPFFDLEFSLPLLEDEDRIRHDSDSDANDAEDLDLIMSPDAGRCGRVGGSLRRDSVASFSPSDQLFFKGRLLPLEPASLSDLATFKPRPCSKPHVPAFLLKSATKFRVLKLRFHNKSKSNTLQHDHAASTTTKQLHTTSFINLKAEEAPLGALFSRNSSSRSSCSGRSARLYGDEASPISEAGRSRKDAIQRYISKIKPLYIRISKRYGEKLRFSGPLGDGAAGKVRPAGEAGEATMDPSKELFPVAGSLKVSLKSQDGNMPAGLRVVYQRLRKSRSASAAASSMRSPPLVASRQDDSLLQQQHGIQSAIAHCKRSFNRGSESLLMRCRSDPSDRRSMEPRSSANF